MNRHAVPLLLAAVLTGGGGGAATWALASDNSPTSKGNEAPIDDNHRGLPSPTAVPATSTAPRPTSTHEASHEATHEASHGATHEATHRASSEPEPGDDRGGATRAPEPGDDHGVDPTPEPNETRHGGDDSGHSGGSDDGSGHS